MKKNRHQKLKELVEQYEIETQDELAEKLKEAGFDVTQATVSRDIRELKLTKVPTGNGRQKYTILVHSDHYLSDKYIRVSVSYTHLYEGSLCGIPGTFSGRTALNHGRSG